MAYAILRPAGDGSPLQWTPTPGGTHYTTIDEVVLQPTAGDTGDYIAGGADQSIDTFELSDRSDIDSCSEFLVWVYCGRFSTAVNLSVTLNIAGADLTWAIDIATDTAPHWVYRFFYGTWTQAQVNAAKGRVRYEDPDEYGDWVRAYTAYARIDYTAAAGPAGLKTINGLAKASIKTLNGLPLASVKTRNGLA